MKLSQDMPERWGTPCPECEGDLLEQPSYGFVSRCRDCGRIQHKLRCSTEGCKFYRFVCGTCSPFREKPKQAKHFHDGNKGPLAKESQLHMKCSPKLCTIVCIISAVGLWIFLPATGKDLSVNNLLKNLKENYPSQRNETWYHFLSVLEKKPPTVKSITFLHGADKRTTKCLMNELVSLFSENKNLGTEQVMFSGDEFEGKDYGLALEYCRAKVKSFGVFVADLTEVSGNIARIFHTLCDDVSSDLKPSLFVFALRYDKRAEHLKPMEVATQVLKKAWQDLPGNELSPLLSRVIKNVVDVVPEPKPPC